MTRVKQQQINPKNIIVKILVKLSFIPLSYSWFYGLDVNRELESLGDYLGIMKILFALFL